MPDPIHSFDWQNLAAMASVMALIVGAAVVYLRLFVRGEIDTSTESITSAIEKKYISREVADLTYVKRRDQS